MLVAIDLDGTLLSDDGSISQENVETIHEAQRQGHIIIVSSGRSFHDIKQILQNAGIACSFIAGNGGILFDKGRIIRNYNLSEKAVFEIIETLEKEELYYELNSKKGILLKCDGREMLNREVSLMEGQKLDFSIEWARHTIKIQFKQYGLIYVPEFHVKDSSKLDVYKIFVLSFDKSKLFKLREKLMNRTDISITSAGFTKLEIGSPDSSKGNALEIISDELAIPLEKTIAIGDQLNDLSMFEIAGVSIAMGNAIEEVKERSTYVTKNNNENGVAYALRKYILA